MKYKNLKSMAHNHSHSFVSWMNYVDDIHVMSEIRRLFAENDGLGITVTWMPEVGCTENRSPTLKKSIKYWGDHLPQHMENHEVTASMIRTFETQFTITIQRGIRIESVLVDERGREYRQSVSY